jgi:hypothetical protein
MAVEMPAVMIALPPATGNRVFAYSNIAGSTTVVGGAIGLTAALTTGLALAAILEHRAATMPLDRLHPTFSRHEVVEPRRRRRSTSTACAYSRWRTAFAATDTDMPGCLCSSEAVLH